MTKQHGAAASGAVHAPTLPVSAANPNPQPMACAICSVNVSKRRLKRHMRKVHGEGKTGAASKGKSKKRRRTAPLPVAAEAIRQTAAEIRAALEEQRRAQDQEIADYLRRNPIKEVGKFGVPQDKYRWGFYGSKSMEYDAWGRNGKQR